MMNFKRWFGLALLALCSMANAAGVATGSIKTQNLTSSGDCTADSCVVMDIRSAGAIQVGVANTYTASGGLVAQLTLDGKAWTTLAGAATFTKVSDNSTSATIPSGATGQYQVSGIATGARSIRLVPAGAVTGQADITMAWGEPAIGSSGGGGSGVDPRVAQASTTSGQTGALVQAAATTAAPTYGNGTTNPLSTDTAGNLRVNVVTGGTSGAVSQASTTSGQTGSLVQGAVTTAAPTYTTAQTNPISLDTAGNTRVISSTANTKLDTLHTDLTADNLQLALSRGQQTQANSNSVTPATGDAAPVAPGAATAVRAIVAGGTYNSSAPTLTNGQQSGIQLTAAGALQTNDAAAAAKYQTGTPQATGSDLRLPVAQADALSVTTTVISAVAATATVTTPVASPGVVNWTAHGLTANQPITITGGTLPAELTTPASGATFYVSATGLAANTFQVSRTPGGASVNFTGSSSGTQTGTQLLVPYTVNTAGYGSISHQTIIVGSTTTQWEASEDAQTWNTVNGLISNGGNTTAPVNSATVAGSWRFPTQFGLWFRPRLTTYSSGSYTTAATLRKDQFQAGVGAISSSHCIKSEDLASANGDNGCVQMIVRNDTLANNTSADLDYQLLIGNKWGAALTANYQQHAKSYAATVNVAAAASATDIATICGNATTPAAVTRIQVSGTQTTAGTVDLQLVKRSAADTGGTSGAGTAVPLDSGDGAANSAVLGYTANPSGLGTAVGTIRRGYVPVGQSTSLTDRVAEYAFGDRAKPIFLKTTSECLAVNLNGATVGGGTFSVTFEWLELAP